MSSKVRRLLALITSVLAGLVGASLLMVVFLTGASYSIGGGDRTREILFGNSGPGLETVEMVAVVLGLAVGFAVGLALWALFTMRCGWLKRSEIEALLVSGRSSESGER